MSFDGLKNSKRLAKSLQKKLGEAGTPERGGVIVAGPKLIELDNIAEGDDAYTCDSMALVDLMAEHELVGTWHTHPGATANLSMGDADTFAGWPDLAHVIVGTDGPRWYAVKNGAVINAS